MSDDRDQEVVFSVGVTDGQPLIILGIPHAAWTHLKDGGVTHFDLDSTGLPVKLVLFGGKDHRQIMDTLDKVAKASGSTYEDRRRDDFGISGADGNQTDAEAEPAI